MCWIPCCSPWSRAFPPPPPLPVSPPALFGGFAGSTPVFDSSLAFMPGLRFWLPGPIRWLITLGCRRGLSVLARAVSRRAYGSWTTPGRKETRDIVSSRVAFPWQALGQYLVCVFRSSIPRPPMPLSTLHPAPHGARRKTRGQDGSLLLSCGALSSPTARRFIPTIALAHARGSVFDVSHGTATVRERLDIRDRPVRPILEPAPPWLCRILLECLFVQLNP